MADLKTMSAKQLGMFIAICGAVVFIGCLLPWWSWSGPFGGSVSIGGTSSTMGVFALILGLAGGGGGVAVWQGKTASLPLNARQLACAILGAFGLAALFTFIDVLRSSGGEWGSVGGGKSFGIYLTLIAALAGGGFSWLLFQKTPAPPPGATPPPPAPGAPPPSTPPPPPPPAAPPPPAS